MPNYRGKSIDSVWGYSDIDSDGNMIGVYVDPPGLHSCCVACQEVAGICAAAWVVDDTPTACQILFNNNLVCPPQKQSLFSILSCDNEDGPGYGALNGNCGIINEFEEGCE